MREGWTYKKLGEVAEIVGGSTPQTNNPNYWGGSHFWVTPAELGESIYIGETQRTITDEAINKTNLTLLPVGTVLLSSRAPIGKTAITTVPMYCNQGFKNIICSDKLHNKFVYYYIGHIVPQLQSLGRGATFKEISKSIVKDIPVPVPPLAEQERVVAELDLLSSVIDKKKAQLSEYDQLAQSIFYDMFGDPITNEKGWEVKKLGEVCLKISDGSHNPPIGVGYSRYLMLSSKNVTNQGFTFDEPRYLTKVQFEAEHKRTNVKKGDVFLVIVGAGVGKSCVYDKNYPVTLQRSVAVLSPNIETVNSIYLNRFLLVSRDVICNEAKGAAQKGIYLNQLSKVSIPIPPLSLQQQFAEKIEAIEKQKVLVQASIAETETLFNSRMDYYFN